MAGNQRRVCWGCYKGALTPMPGVKEASLRRGNQRSPCKKPGVNQVMPGRSVQQEGTAGK